MKIKFKGKQTKKLDNKLKQLTTMKLKVGVLGNESVEGVPVKKYAVYNEYGGKNIPARPFFRTATRYGNSKQLIIKRHKDNILNLLDTNVSANGIMNNLGLYVKGRIIKSIKKGNWTPNSPYTISKKGVNKAPLINTGTLVRSINFEVVE